MRWIQVNCVRALRGDVETALLAHPDVAGCRVRKSSQTTSPGHGVTLVCEIRQEADVAKVAEQVLLIDGVLHVAIQQLPE